MIIKHDVSLRQFNSFGVDSKASNLVVITDVDDIQNLIESGLTVGKHFILGGGTNLLFVGDYDGTIIKNELIGIVIVNEDDDSVIVEAASGVVWHEFVDYCISHNFYGLENLALIPGTVGSAPVQNIGAYGVEQKDFFVSLTAINLSDNSQITLTKDDCIFCYRYSAFKQPEMKNYLITSVRYKLSKNDLPNIAYKDLKKYFSEHDKLKINAKNVFDAVIAIRQRKLPDYRIIGNAGSFFKNPIVSEEYFDNLKTKFSEIVGFTQNGDNVKLSAAWLIDKAGWKGRRLKDAGVYEKHSLILVNHGSASGEDILNLSVMIQESILKTFGVGLEREIIVID